MYRFYSEGFWGYGQEGVFQPDGIWRLIPVLLLFLAVFVTRKKHGVLQSWKHERRFRFILSFVMLMAEMGYFRRLLYVGDKYGSFLLLTRLPIYGTLYMMIVHGKRPRYRHLWYAVGCLGLSAIPSYFANEAIPAADYLYVKLDIPLMPQNQLMRMLVFGVIIMLLFHGMWFIWTKTARQAKKEGGAEK